MNGMIKRQTTLDGYWDDKGAWHEGINGWSEPVACKYFANTLNNRGRYNEGTAQFTQSAYEITIEDDIMFGVEDVESLEEKPKSIIIQLLNSRGNFVCEKPIQSLEVLESVQRVKITV